MKKCSLALIPATLILITCGGGSGSQPSNNNPPVPGNPTWIRDSANPLIVPRITTTALGIGPADPSVMFDDGRWKVWFSEIEKPIGTGNARMHIKYAESLNGVNWSEPVTVMSAATNSNAWDYTHTETPSVIRNPDTTAPASQRYLMYYSGANTDLASAQLRPTTIPYYQIGLAYSADGRSFTRMPHASNSNLDGLLLSASAAILTNLPSGYTYGDGLLADPEILYRDGQFHLWFSSFAETVPAPVAPTGRSPLALGISHLTSSNGLTWTAAHPNPLASLYKPNELAGGIQPSVIFNTDTNQYEMWFSNDTEAEKLSIPCSFNTVRGFWRAVSSDGSNWTVDYTARDFSYSTAEPYEELGFMTGVDAAWVGNTRHLFYGAWGTEQVPDPNYYGCKDHQGNLLTGVITLNRARFATP